MAKMTPHDWSTYVQGLLLASREAPAARLARARRYIDQHFDQPLTLRELSKRSAYSQFHFSRSFSETFGASPQAYLAGRRMEAAARLLRETDLSVTAVCLAVGYQSLGSFSTRFRRQFGHPPSKARRVLVPGICMPRVAVPGCFFPRPQI